MNTNSKYFNLLYAYQGDATLCHAKDPSITIEEYEELQQTEEYEEYLANIQKRFLAHLDTTLIANQAKAHQMLDDIYNGKTDMKYLKDVSKHFTDLLKLTEPIVERLGKQVREEERLSGLTLVIQKPEDKNDI